MTPLTDLDMLYDYEQDIASAAMGYITLATRAHNEELRVRYLKMANEASSAHSKVSKLITKCGGIA